MQQEDFAMLKVDHISVMNLENAIRGARNPLNSWARSDSCYNETAEIHPPNPGVHGYHCPPVLVEGV